MNSLTILVRPSSSPAPPRNTATKLVARPAATEAPAEDWCSSRAPRFDGYGEGSHHNCEQREEFVNQRGTRAVIGNGQSEREDRCQAA